MNPEMLKELENYVTWKVPVVWNVADPVAHTEWVQIRNPAATASVTLSQSEDEFNYATLKYPIKKDIAVVKEFMDRWKAAKDGHPYLSDDEFFSVLCEEENESK